MNTSQHTRMQSSPVPCEWPVFYLLDRLRNFMRGSRLLAVLVSHHHQPGASAEHTRRTSVMASSRVRYYEEDSKHTIRQEVLMTSKAYSERTINGLKAVATNNDQRRERAKDALVRLAATGTQRKNRR